MTHYMRSWVQQRKRVDVRFLSGVFSRCECVSGRIDGSNGNTFDSTGSGQSMASLRGRAVIYSDCLGALGRVANLPPHRIPTKCRHSDILKNILVNCTSLSFTLAYSHVKAHQDDTKNSVIYPGRRNLMYTVMAWQRILFGDSQERNCQSRGVFRWNRYQFGLGKTR